MRLHKSGTTTAPETSKEATLLHCRGMLAHHAKSFRWAAVFLSNQARDDAAVAYAFCRAIDDAVDEAPTPDCARASVKQFAQILNGTIAGDEVARAYCQVAEQRDFGLQPAKDLLLGVESDLQCVRIQNDEELLTYCYRVAGTVGLMMCGILGVTDLQAKKHALDLGVAMQLTNICRDVLEDAGRGRVYLPAERLRARGVCPDDLVALVEGQKGTDTLVDPQRIHAQVALVVGDLLQMADEKYFSASLGFRYLPTRARLAIMVASHLYRAIGTQLRSIRSCDSLAGRVVVSTNRKIVLTIQATGHWLRTLLPFADHSKKQEEISSARAI